jgi:hypothetical protein
VTASIHAIQTSYAGYRFRSRTEARWAVFLNDLGLKWEYETQGFIVGRERRPYLPDFHLPELGLWLEVKPSTVEGTEPDGVDLWADFAGMVFTEWETGKTAMLIGPIPDPQTVDREGPPKAKHWYDPGIVILGDWHYAWCACPTGKHFDVQYEARGAAIECGCPRVTDGRLRSGNHPAILDAYRAARGARFEHGETPAA